MMADRSGTGREQPDPKVYIVLVNWNGWKDTVECLESIYRSDYRNYQVVVVDNGSDDDSVRHLKAWANREFSLWKPPCHPLRGLSIPPVAMEIPLVSCSSETAQRGGDGQGEKACPGGRAGAGRYPLVLIEGRQNLGFGRANNIAFRYISAKNDFKYVWLLNNDTVVEPDSLSLMVQAASPSPAIVGSLLRHYDNPGKVQAYGGGYVSTLTGRVKTEDRARPERLDFVTGASLMIDGESLRKIGWFDDKIFMYFEDIEYCIRARAIGIPLRLSRAVVYHKIGASNKEDGSYFAWVNGYRGKIHSFMKHRGLGFWFVCLLASLIINIISPNTGSNKRRASMEILLHGLPSLIAGGPK
jgi:GT2 family glycosyltransferase